MKRNIILSIAVFIFTLIIYFFTVAPGLTFTDAGELAGACSTLGIAHPTGYPLFTVLGYLWLKLPISDSNIFSLNIFAAFLTALSTIFFFNTVYLILSNLNQIKGKADKKNFNKKEKKFKVLDEKYILIISTISAFTYAFAKTIWEQAVAIEVYSLHLLLINIIIYTFLKAWFENKKNYYFISALVLGLSFTNHMTTILIVPMLIFLYFFDNQIANNKFKFLLFLFIPFIIGLSLYLYLPLRSLAFPEFNWGWVSRSFDKFWYHFSGKQYQVWMFSGTDIMKDNFLIFLKSLPYQLGWIGLIPFLYGFVKLYQSQKQLFWGLIILIITCIFYALNYSIHDIESYFSAAFIGFILLSSIGIFYFSSLNKNLIYFSILIPIISFAMNYSTNDRSDDYIVEEYTRLLFQSLEPNAVIISSQWDYWVSAAWYLQRIENFRPDVVIIDKELLRRTWYFEQLKRWYPERIAPCNQAIEDFLIDLELFESGNEYSPISIQRKFINLLDCFVNSNIDNYPVYITLDVIETEPDMAKNYEKAATGFAFKLIKNGDNEKVDINIDRFDIYRLKQSILNNEGHLVDGVKTITALNFVNIARYTLMTGDKETARKALEKGYEIDPTNRFVLDAINNFKRFKFE